ncbi:universal stress protein [Azospirillum picis]|uniref:Nucleotide-binding universal stress UspA family protein n=1 Tax=Azospirillum picis TaxID=488438 RepID=A0ABU0MQ10_9PROT|nr:universal stress protein [Azospirillum picis]MBP2301610.1 nucleotide-binding universal stress UspA family protein [Azospirillum picis]MDQ0535567.1 nucleotide-binding universal stress UspA family protein [Azospirillum picis]
MALKDFLVVLDDTPACAARLDLAARLAARCDAHLTALYATNDMILPGYIEAEIPQEMREGRRHVRQEQTGRMAAAFEDAMRRNGMTDRSEWLAVEGDPTLAAAVRGRYADLIVVGQLDPDRDRDQPVAQPADLLFESGRPLLVVPYAGRFATVGERILVGWNGSREAARAIGDAMPLLETAKRVVVMAANPKPGPNGLGDEPCADIARHLSRHGCRVEATHVATNVVEPGDTLLNAAADESCDLLVMGAYGRSRFRELVLGGMTRFMLQHMTVPVLMSH